jgi:hypothetical protein
MRTYIAAIFAAGLLASSIYFVCGCATESVAVTSAPPPIAPPTLAPAATTAPPAPPPATAPAPAATPVASTPSEPATLVEVGHTTHREAASPVQREGVAGAVRYDVAVLDAKADTFARALLRDTGQGILGQDAGSAVKVDFPDGNCGPGWVDAKGDLQAVIYVPHAKPQSANSSPLDDPCVPARYAPAAGHRLFELRNSSWSEVKPALRLEMRKAAKATGPPVDAMVSVLDARGAGASTRSLAEYLGIAVGRDYRGRVRLQLSPGASVAGLLREGGKLSFESTDAWSPELRSAERPNAAATSAGAADSHPECAKNVCIEVDERVMQSVRALGGDIVFFTSKKRPLHFLTEIKYTGTELGMWGMELLDGSQALLRAAQVEVGAGGKGLARVLGDAYFSSLFANNPEIRLFVTHAYEDHREAAIGTRGGGARLYFVPEGH